jgi:hypothetical protein
MSVSCDNTPRRLLYRYQRFRAACYFHLQGILTPRIWRFSAQHFDVGFTQFGSRAAYHFVLLLKIQWLQFGTTWRLRHDACPKQWHLHASRNSVLFRRAGIFSTTVSVSAVWNDDDFPWLLWISKVSGPQVCAVIIVSVYHRFRQWVALLAGRRVVGSQLRKSRSEVWRAYIFSKIVLKLVRYLCVSPLPPADEREGGAKLK